MFIFCAMHVYKFVELLWSSMYHGKWLEWIKIFNLEQCANLDKLAARQGAFTEHTLTLSHEAVWHTLYFNRSSSEKIRCNTWLKLDKEWKLLKWKINIIIMSENNSVNSFKISFLFILLQVMCRYVKCGHLCCVFPLTWLNRLTLKDILFDGTATSHMQRRAKRGKQRWRCPVTTSLFLAIMLLLLSGGVHTNAGLTIYPCLKIHRQRCIPQDNHWIMHTMYK